ncbi:MAG TPA: ABC transporter permease, partial [Puia sp.]
MIKSSFLLAWRNLLKYKALSFVNIGGLVIGLTSALLLLSHVSFQSSFDSFNTQKENIYRVNLSYYENSKLVIHSAENYSGLASALKKDIPEVLDAARLYNMGYKNNCVFTYNNNSFRETNFLYADASFFKIFTYPFIKGDPSTALSRPYTAVISASLAKKIFGTTDPVGASIKMDDDDRNSELCKITGVFQDPPPNSHLQFDILISYPTLYSR